MGKDLLKEVKQEAKEIKNNKKETNKMQNSTKKSVIISVTVTVLFIASLAGMFLFGMNYEANKTAQIHAEAKALVSTVAPSKQ